MSAPFIDIQPNTRGLPGLAALENIVGGLLTFGLVAAVAGVALSAVAWAIGSHSSNPHVAGKGKSGVLVAAGAAMLHWRGQHPRHLLQQCGRRDPVMRTPRMPRGAVSVALAVVVLAATVRRGRLPRW